MSNYRILSIQSDLEGFNVTIDTESIDTLEIKKIQWSYQNQQLCCEKFGTNMSHPIECLQDRQLVNILLKDESCGEYNSIILTLETTDTVWTIEFYNRHYGDFCHNLFISINNDIIYNSTI